MKRQWLKYALLSLLLLALSTSTYAQATFELPVGMELEYSFHYNGAKIGTMQRSLSQSANQDYIFESHVQATSLLARLFLKEIKEENKK